MKHKTLIFDLDGTLLDTLDDLCSAFNYALKTCGYRVRTKSELKSFVGNGVKKALDRATDNSLSEDELLRLTNCFKKYYISFNSKKTKPYPGIIDLLKNLKEKGCKTAVVSNKFDEAVKMLCNGYFNGYIDYAVGESNKTRKKPEIDGIKDVCNKLSADLSECIYIGDSDIDILTAKNAKIPCISVSWGFRTKDFLIKSGAKIIADTPNDILKLIT